MNLTELARILRINPQELRDLLPELGFGIGQKAIKVDAKIAKKIIKNWPVLIAKYREMKAHQELKVREELEEKSKNIKKVTIPSFITIREFASVSGVPVSQIVSELMKNGVFASINERIDFETASIIGSDLYLDVELDESLDHNDNIDESSKLRTVLENEDASKMIVRPPVIVVMGHVDHGKTKLLDAIRRTNVIAGEAGGITQHIGAYQVTRKKHLLTFIDTPGHEAFTAMRSRGAKVADIAILVVAADDGVKPQTVEAFRIIQTAKIPYIVAINKIDKEGADIMKTKQELSTKLGITPEDWGGKTVCLPISALKGDGIDDVLDMLILIADTESDHLLANPGSDAIGTVIESNIDKAAGPVATILIQNGTLHNGDQLCFNNINYGKVRAFKNYKGEIIETAGPSTPVKIIGLKTAPRIGDIIEVGDGKRIKLKKIKSKLAAAKSVNNDDSDDGATKINLIIKSDVLGSAEAIEESLMKINTKKVKVKILGKGLGNITEGDVKKAVDSNAELISFHVGISPQIMELARENNISIKQYSVIYDLIKYVKDKMKELVIPEIRRVDLGKLRVMAIFRTEARGQIVGGRVTSGTVENGCFVEVFRNKEFQISGKIAKLQSGKQDVPIVETNQECGLGYEGSPIIEVGDTLNFYKEEQITEDL